MRKVKQNIVAITLGLGLGLSVTTAEAITPFVYDVTRTAEFAIQGVQRMLSYVSEAQKVESKEEEKKTWEKRKNNKDAQEGGSDGGESGGSEGGGESKDDDGCKSSKKLPYENNFYRYMGGKTDLDMADENDEDKSEKENDENEFKREEIDSVKPMSMGSEKYLPATSDTKTAEEYIREKFFFDPDLTKVTETKKNEIIQHRYAYLETLAQEVLEISQGARKAILSDLSTLGQSKTTAGGDINQVEFMIQTKKAMVEQKAADIILQAKLMELEAAKMFLNISPQRIENPNKTK